MSASLSVGWKPKDGIRCCVKSLAHSSGSVTGRGSWTIYWQEAHYFTRIVSLVGKTHLLTKPEMYTLKNGLFGPPLISHNSLRYQEAKIYPPNLPYPPHRLSTQRQICPQTWCLARRPLGSHMALDAISLPGAHHPAAFPEQWHALGHTTNQAALTKEINQALAMPSLPLPHKSEPQGPDGTRAGSHVPNTPRVRTRLALPPHLARDAVCVH